MGFMLLLDPLRKKNGGATCIEKGQKGDKRPSRRITARLSVSLKESFGVFGRHSSKILDATEKYTPRSSSASSAEIAHTVEDFKGVDHDTLASLFGSIHEHQKSSMNSFDLVASNSFISGDVRRVMGSAMMNSYCIGLPGARFYGGCSEIDDIEVLTRELACQVFGAQFCEVQLLSGMLANIAAYNAMLPHRGCTVMASPSKNGGHYSHNAGGPLTQLFGANVVPTPWSAEEYNVNVEALPEAMDAHNPDLLILGWSEMLFEHDLPTIRSICDQHGCKIMFDMSHVAGLVAGGVFQSDMMDYADIVTSSTGKSFHSADHGLILYNDPSLTPKIREAVMPLLTSNTHFHETAALALVLMEMQAFGASYAKQVVANTKALARELAKRKFTVLCEELGYSNTHEIILSLNFQGEFLMTGPEATSLLDRAGIYINPQELPSDTASTGAFGLRIGTQVLTRRGFKEEDMVNVADAIEAALVKDIQVETVAKLVAQTCSHFDKVKFAFNDDVPEPPSPI